MNKTFNIKSIFEFDKKKTIFSAILAVIIFIICCFKYTIGSGIAFSLLFLIAGVTKIKNINPKAIIIFNIVWAIFVIMIPVLSCTYLTGDVLCFKIGPVRVILNILCVLLLSHLMMIFTGKWRLSISVIVIALTTLLTFNDIIFELSRLTYCLKSIINP